MAAPVSQDSASYLVTSASLLGLDTAVESPHFTIYCHKADEEKAKELVTVSEKDYPALARLFPTTPRTDVLITYDVNEYVNVFTAAPPWGAEAYKDPNSGAGAFCPGCTKSLGDNTEYVYMLRPGNVSFAHELAHRYYWASYPNLRMYTDISWLNEGQAVYAQTEVAPGPGGLSSNLARINDNPLPNTFVALKQLLEKGDNASTERFYDLVGLLAYYLDGKVSGGLYSFIANLNSTGDVDKTCQNKLGLNCDQVFAAWKGVVIKTSASDSSEFLTKYKKLVAS
jgi:hypothetical protein